MEHYQKTLQKIFPQGLPQFELYENPFGEEFSARILLYPTLVCMLEEDHYACLQNFMKLLKEDSVVITDFFRLTDSHIHEDDPTWVELPADTGFDVLDSHKFMPTTAFFSPNATWGLIISDSEYAIIATKEEFRQPLLDSFAPCLQQWKTLVADLPYPEPEEIIAWADRVGVIRD